MKLLLDLGNSRLKWAWSQDGVLEDGGALDHADDPAAAIARLPLRSVAEVRVAQVLGARHAPAIAAAVHARFGRAVAFARSEAETLGLHNGYAEPERLGVDRWLALIGAWQRHRRPLVVADAGTALTVDCVDADGRHLGGLIAPGLLTAQRTLLDATHFATRMLDTPYGAALGRDTESCVRQGALHSVLGAVDRVSRSASPDAVRIMTGGDAALLLTFLDAGWEHAPLLVLEGLAALPRGDGLGI